jgi:transportin-3
MQEGVLKCFVSWIRSNDMTAQHLAPTPLLQLLSQAIRTDELFEPSVELICEIIRECCTQSSDSLSLVHQVCTCLASLMDLVESCFTEDGQERQRNICRIFVEAGEAFCTNMVEDFPR